MFTRRFDTRPKLGLAVWFAAFLSSGLATALALLIAVASVFETYSRLSANQLGSTAWLSALALSFAPWLILAISGIALAIINQRIEPLISDSREMRPVLDAALRPWMRFEGHEVMRIELPIMMAAVVHGKIVFSTLAARTLHESELHAVMWHEIGHKCGRHNQLKSLAAFVRKLSPWLVASQIMVSEISRLCELDADLYALRYVPEPLLTSTRAKFVNS